ncbi:cell wall vacuolar inhibitor of fructosidase 1-like [Olea europaea subsp. europaea]|uniref:Cell wall vacuolar inhibitor of fructosidase 1-like n=1 Tax=Olea europaea subsp. europaea TaxID=158383 RepID=A0A8S0TAV8_OLEEU|nr:cell wall vacuolar inhibitor of fructosidase 1-like [Olea europaea subsp. europaea]
MMMKVLFAIMMFTFHVHGIPQEKDQNLINTTCRNTPNYRLCISTLRADPTSINEDVAGLGLIMVAAVKAKAKETMKAITKLKVSRPELRIALNDCSDRYNAILVGDVPEAEQALRGNPKFAENGMADSSIEAVACEENFKKVKSPLTGFNNKMRDLSDVARAIIRNLL